MKKCYEVLSGMKSVRLFVKVVPSSSCNKIGEVLDGKLKVYVTAVPENGKANKYAIKLISGMFGVSSSSVHIVKGETVNVKTIIIKGADYSNIPDGLK